MCICGMVGCIVARVQPLPTPLSVHSSSTQPHFGAELWQKLCVLRAHQSYPSTLLGTGKRRRKKKKWIPNSAIQLAGNPRPDLQLIQTGLIPQTSLEILDLQQHRGAVPVFPSLAGKSMCFFSESRPSLRSKLSTVLIKETSQQQFNSIKFHVFSFKSLK